VTRACAAAGEVASKIKVLGVKQTLPEGASISAF
jgi:hypothetical protein